ncbi:MAG: YIP1 family protein, partial [Patescibacteria group bacterium]
LHPFILSLNVSRLFTVSLTTYIGICLLLLVLGKMVGGKPNLRAILLGWGYSLIPTLIWFFATSLFYLLLPPPRTETILGRSFSLIFNTFSLSLFFWKGMLYYLTLRFGMKLDLRQISVISVIFLPLLVVYAVLMYRFHIFRVPFV